MSTLHAQLDRYLSFRRDRGYRLHETGQRLRGFVQFMEREGAAFITTELCRRWNTQQPASHMTMEQRMIAIRGFAQWLKLFDPRNDVPPPYRGQHGKNRPKPYIFTQEDIDKLLQASAQLPSPKGCRRLTYPVLWGFLYITGLRLGEALDLGVEDINFQHGTVRVKAQKGSYERLVPLHPTTADALRQYLSKRHRLLGKMVTCLFADEEGRRLSQDAVRATFAQVGMAIGLRPAAPLERIGKGPRIHDLRHTFAVNTLKQWYEEGKDVREHILTLVDVLGHSSLKESYWYLEAVPELLHLASSRFESYLASGEVPA